MHAEWSAVKIILILKLIYYGMYITPNKMIGEHVSVITPSSAWKKVNNLMHDYVL